MRTFALTAALIVASGAAPAQDAFSLKGTWTGARERIAKDEGWREGTATLVITDQKGRTFSGHLLRSNPSGDVREELWGAFTPNGRLNVAADEEGTYAFDLVDGDTLDYCYAKSGRAARVTCARLQRRK
jgi:hypothetical protein